MENNDFGVTYQKEKYYTWKLEDSCSKMPLGCLMGVEVHLGSTVHREQSGHDATKLQFPGSPLVAYLNYHVYISG